MQTPPQPMESNFKKLFYLLWSTLQAKGNFAEGIRRLLVRYRKLSLPLKLGRLHLWITVDPEEVRRILIKQTDRFQKIPLEKKVLEPVMKGGLILLEGKEWRDHREAMAPCFDTEQMAALIRISDEAAGERCKNWNGLVNVSHEMRCIINDVMARFFMGNQPLGQGAGEASLDCYGQYFRDVEAGLEARVLDPLKLRELWQRHFRAWSRFDRSLQGVNDMIQRRIEAASPSNGSRNPLSILLDSFTRESVFEELRTLGGAGATSVHHLSWTCHLLASHPEVQENLRHEILEQMNGGQTSSTVPLSELDDMPYLSAVTQESMRLFPPAPFMFRSDCQSRTYVVLPIWAMQRHPDFWDKPESFLPQRWLERGKTYPSFIPFGSGPRFCIARRFSIIETKMILMKILSNFSIDLWTRKPPVPKVHIMTRPRKDIQLLLKPLSRSS